MPHFGIAGGASVAAIAYELVAALPNVPVVALVSPAQPGPIAVGATITIDVTDADGDLSTVAITANGETVTVSGTSLVSPFTGGSILTITNGKRFVFPRTGGWTGSTLGISVIATDTQGQITPASYAWTVAAVVTHAPVVTLVSPPLGSIPTLATITIDVTDADGDLSAVAIVANGQEVTATGVTLTGPFTGAISPITGPPAGKRFAFARTGGFSGTFLGVTVVATDVVGNVTAVNFGWTPVTFSDSAGTTSTASRAEATGADIWFDLASDGADRVVTPAGDWKLVDGDEALRQSLLRRLLTSPGEWARLPDYGCGARDYVNEPDTQANRDELANRIRAQFLRDYRVATVQKVTIDLSRPGIVRMEIKVTSKATPKTNTPITIAVGVG